MGFFDRFRRPVETRYEYADRPITNRVVDDTTPSDQRVIDRPVTDERVVTDHHDNSGWLWLLLIPLFLLLGLGAYSYLANTNGVTGNQPNFLSRLFNHSNDTTTGNSSNGLQFGVGGAPATPTPTPTGNTGASTSSVTATPTPTSSAAGSVQGTSTRQLPGEAPSTGRGGE